MGPRFGEGFLLCGKMRVGAPRQTVAHMTPEGLIPMQPQSSCSIPDCNNRHLARGWCQKHYTRWRKHGDPLVTLNPGLDQTDAERFYAKVVLQANGCRLWTGAISGNPGGYGQFWVGGKLVGAHRWAYEHEIGPIPDGLTLDHLCRVRACVEVTHLEPVTLRENILRGVGIAAQTARALQSYAHCAILSHMEVRWHE